MATTVTTTATMKTTKQRADGSCTRSPISLDVERKSAGFGGNEAAFLPRVALSLESVEFAAESVQHVIVVMTEEIEGGRRKGGGRKEE